MMYAAVKTNRVELSEDVLEWVIGGAAAPVIYETTTEDINVDLVADETSTGKVKRPAQSSANKEKKLLVSGH